MPAGTVTNRRTQTTTEAVSRVVVSMLLLISLGLICGCKSGTAGKVVTVAVDPTGVNVVIGKTLQFNATVTDTFNTAVTWSVAGGSANGTISATGLYTAPAKLPKPAIATRASMRFIFGSFVTCS